LSEYRSDIGGFAILLWMINNVYGLIQTL
jgi:hypothetical protein